MNIKTVRCDSCGKVFTNYNPLKTPTCSHCGAVLFESNNIRQQRMRYAREDQIREEKRLQHEYESEKYQESLRNAYAAKAEENNRKKKLIIIAVIIGIIILGLAISTIAQNSSNIASGISSIFSNIGNAINSFWLLIRKYILMLVILGIAWFTIHKIQNTTMGEMLVMPTVITIAVAIVLCVVVFFTV